MLNQIAPASPATSLPLDRSDSRIAALNSLLLQVSPTMSREQIRETIGSIPGIAIQPESPASLTAPFWGVIPERFARLQEKYQDRIRSIIGLIEHGDNPLPEKTSFRLDPEDYFTESGVTVRAIKIKGISRNLLPVAEGTERAIRNSGYGNTPILEQNVGVDGSFRSFINHVGEPFGGKRFRGAFNEFILTECQLAASLPSMLPIGVGILENKNLIYRGEPPGFIITGVESPEDIRLASIREQIFDQLSERHDERQAGLEPEQIREEISDGLAQTQDLLRNYIHTLAEGHRAGFVSYCPHLDNIGVHDDKFYLVDLEPAAHRSRLSSGQFIKGVCIDLLSAIDYCSLVERYLFSELSRHVNRVYSQTIIESIGVENWLVEYFGKDALPKELSDELFSLFPLEAGEIKAADQFIERIEPYIAQRSSSYQYGAGIDWHLAGLPMDNTDLNRRFFVPAENSSLECALFKPYGMAPFGQQAFTTPPREIEKFEELIYSGSFDRARQLLEELYTDSGMADFHGYISYNLAVLCFRERQDAMGEWYLNRAVNGYSGGVPDPRLEIPDVARALRLYSQQ